MEAELAALKPVPAVAAAPVPVIGTKRPPLPLWRRIGIVAACLLIATGAVILVVHFVQARQPGQSSSGGVTLSQAQTIAQQLHQALTLNNQGQTKAALELYNKVLTEDPSNPAALAYAGYLQWDIGAAAHVSALVKIGRAEIETSVRDSPTYYEGHLFYGLVLENQDHNHAAAVQPVQRLPGRRPPGRRAAPGGTPRRGCLQGDGGACPRGVLDRVHRVDRVVSPVAPPGR